MDEIDQMLDIYNDCVRALSRLPEISEDMRQDLLAMEPDRRAVELEGLKRYLAEGISAMAEGQRVLDRAKELLGE